MVLVDKRATLDWLQRIVHRWMGPEWRLAEKPDAWVLELEGASSLSVQIQRNRLFEASASTELPYCEIRIESAPSSKQQTSMLPAPGVKNFKGNILDAETNSLTINYDILGLAFWALTRVEEIHANNLDRHERFKSCLSHAVIHGYLERPIVDEWFGFLKNALERHWPALKFKKSKGSLQVSCDVDRPFRFLVRPSSLPRRILGELVRRRSFVTANKIVVGSIFKTSFDFSGDPWLQNLYWMMDVNEQYNNRVTFNFLCGGRHRVDGDYSLQNPYIRQLAREMLDRGHSIGLHPSYECFKNGTKIVEERDNLLRLLDDLGYGDRNVDCRQHYLRWCSKHSPGILNRANLVRDTSLGYPDAVGFRAGTSREYPMFDHVEAVALAITQQPLVMMESTAIAQFGKGDVARDKIDLLKERAMIFGGAFSLLWHNSDLNGDEDAAMYQYAITP